MITSSREEGFSTKQEGSITDGNKIAKASSSSTPWLKLKDPRIVRVSRAFGGKDRHSKVCTVKGLRDRRVRLSVPTAIQLYDLQDRLGLNQPSKVVDWLLNAAKHEIDELPPLQMPPGNFSQNHHHPMLISHEVGASQYNKEGLKINNIFNLGDPRPNFWNSDAFLRSKSKGIARETINEKENSIKRNDEEKQEGSTIEGTHAAQLPTNFFPRANQSSSLPGLLNNAMPYGSYYHWEPSNISLAQLTDEVPHNFNVVPLPSTLSLPSGSQVLVCPPGATQSYFPSHVTAASVEFDPRQINHFQMLSSSTSQNPLSNISLAPPLYSISQSLRPFHLSMQAPRPINSQNNDSEIQPNKVTEFPSK